MSESIQEQMAETPKNDKEYNFAQLRQQVERERAARIAAEERIAQIEQSQKSVKYEEEDDSSDEPYVDNKRLKKTMSKLKEELVKEIDQKAEVKARTLFDEERRQTYFRENPDFHSAMSEEVIQRFADTHPRLADSILRMPDGFERQKLVYENIKAFGLDKPAQKQPSIQERIDANKKSPYYQPSGMSGAPYAGQSDFSDSGQKNAYDKMKELQKRLRG